MLTHDTIWLAIDRLAQSCGYSTSGLAKKSGLDPTSFNRSKRIGVDGKPRWPSTESIALILSATNSTMADFISLISPPEMSPRGQTRIPVLGLAHAARTEHFDDKGNPQGMAWEHIHFPNAPEERHNLYALEISGTSLLPLFREGDRLIVDPNAPIRRGDRVIVKTLSGKILTRELSRQTATKVELKSLTDKTESESLSPKDIVWIARILWVSQ